MKIITLLSISLLFSFTAFSIEPNTTEPNTEQTLQQVEMIKILDEVFDMPESRLVSQIKKTNKVIIMDNHFNKIREAFSDKEENISNQSILQPFINRSQFIAKVHNVSYYMLEKK